MRRTYFKHHYAMNRDYAAIVSAIVCCLHSLYIRTPHSSSGVCDHTLWHFSKGMTAHVIHIGIIPIFNNIFVEWWLDIFNEVTQNCRWHTIALHITHYSIKQNDALQITHFVIPLYLHSTYKQRKNISLADVQC